MRAVWYERFGSAREVLRLGEMPDPEPGPGEVRIRLRASGVNPSDVKTRAGATRRPTAFPRVIPHSDGAGVIDAVGSGVPPTRIGERVWVHNAQWERPFGTAADAVALPSELALPLPEGIGFAEGACIGIPVLTAHLCLFDGAPLAGRFVLVQGGAGVVGHYAVQLASWAGARVIATASSPEKLAHARSAGAEQVIDYAREPVVDRVREITREKGVDRVVEVELGANLPLLLQVLAPHGVVASYASMAVREPVLPVYPLMARNATLRFVLVYGLTPEQKRRALEDLGRWMASGRARFAIAARLPLERTVEAHELVESGRKLGHVVLEID